MTDTKAIDQHGRGSEAAFAELVRRHVDWVYAVAARRVGDRHLAEDVVQAVFMVLHRKGAGVGDEGRVAGWLFRVTQYAAAKALRGELRRRRREKEAAMVQQSNAAADEQWRQLAPLLDSLVAELRQKDREAVLLRFYRRMSFSEVGGTLGTTEEAARKRVDRAVAKLRECARRRGIVVPAAGLAVVLWTNVTAQAAPAGLAGVAATAALGGGTAVISATGASIAQGVISMLSLSKVKVAAMVMGTVLLAGGGTVVVSQLAAQEKPVPRSAATATRPATTQAATAPAAQTLEQFLEEAGASDQQRATAREIVDRAAESWRVWFVEHRRELEELYWQYERAAEVGDQEKGLAARQKHIALISTISPRSVDVRKEIQQMIPQERWSKLEGGRDRSSPGSREGHEKVLEEVKRAGYGAREQCAICHLPHHASLAGK